METTPVKLSAKHIASLAPAELVEDELVKNRFIELHNNFTKTNNGELIYHKELFNYKKLLAENEGLRKCTPLSLYGCFLDLNVNMLSLEGGRNPDCYIIPRNVNVGSKTNQQWESRASLQISPYGELKMRMRAGQIKHADNPVIVYESDKFEVGTNDQGKLVVKNYSANLPRKEGAKIIACFVRIERLDGTWETPYLDMPAVARLAAYSAKQNKGTANALYASYDGQIDPGFLKAKTLKHAFQTYPKVNVGGFSQQETETDAPTDIYGIDPHDASANAIQDVEHEEVDEFEAELANQDEESKAAVETATVDDDDDIFNS